jgi:hypothetical protein
MKATCHEVYSRRAATSVRNGQQRRDFENRSYDRSSIQRITDVSNERRESQGCFYCAPFCVCPAAHRCTCFGISPTMWSFKYQQQPSISQMLQHSFIYSYFSPSPQDEARCSSSQRCSVGFYIISRQPTRATQCSQQSENNIRETIPQSTFSAP